MLGQPRGAQAPRGFFVGAAEQEVGAALEGWRTRGPEDQMKAVQKFKGGGKRNGVAWGTAGMVNGCEAGAAEPRGELLARWHAAKQRPRS